jgi:hypothetical protein
LLVCILFVSSFDNSGNDNLRTCVCVCVCMYVHFKIKLLVLCSPRCFKLLGVWSRCLGLFFLCPRLFSIYLRQYLAMCPRLPWNSQSMCFPSTVPGYFLKDNFLYIVVYSTIHEYILNCGILRKALWQICK